MSRYIDGFVLPVPKDNVEAYRQLAAETNRLWMAHGALAAVECVADDIQPGKVTSFPQAVHLKDDETVVFAWILYESREHRDRVNERVMQDPRMADMDPRAMPFDAMRTFWGGFETLVEYSATDDHQPGARP